MPCKRARNSSAIIAALHGVVLTMSCGGSGGFSPTVAIAGSGTSSSGSSGSAGSSSGGAPASGGSNAHAGAGGSRAFSLGDAGTNSMAAAGARPMGGNAGSGAVGADGQAGSRASSGNASLAGSSNGGGAAGSLPSSDSFEGTTLDASWAVFRPDLADISVADGSLSIAPHAGSLWYQASQADLVYKLVTGNFKATTTVHARRASNRAQTPAQFADVGGIMARNPSGSSENYVLGVVGYAEMNQLAVEHKSTTNGKSVYGEVAFMPDAELRMCRVGSTFTIYYRHPGESAWGPAFAPFERPDLPATVQVGAIAYTGVSAPDFVAIFDSFTFEPLAAGCTQ